MGIKEALIKRAWLILTIILTLITGIVIGYSLSGNPAFSDWMKVLGATVSLSWVTNMLFWGYKEIKQYEDIEKKQKAKIRIKFNNDVFKKWKNASCSLSEFHIEIKMDAVDSYLFEKAKNHLKDESEQTINILELWNKIDENIERSLVSEYNVIGKNVKEKILKCLHEAYPLLQPKEEIPMNIHDKCYVTDNIIKIMECKLKTKLLKNKLINWDNILKKQFYGDVRPPNWTLEGDRVLIQSKNETDVNEKCFQNVMKKIIKSILYDLKQLNKLEKEINKNLKNFKGKMNQLTIDIELNYV